MFGLKKKLTASIIASVTEMAKSFYGEHIEDHEVVMSVDSKDKSVKFTLRPKQ
jgi:hypothetical protein